MERLRSIPSVDRLLRSATIESIVAQHGRTLVLEAIRVELHELRAGTSTTGSDSSVFDEISFAARLRARITRMVAPSQRRVINLTGTVLHTNLGRAVLPREAVDAIGTTLSGPTNLEYDLGDGVRSDRDRHVAGWLARLTGAESGTVVNNNAAAVLVALNTLALRREVLVSRGELIEIGGSFRIPDIMARAGCKLIEVGTTNRTHRDDYVAAIGPRTGAVMKVHTSNYAVQGFVATVSETAMAELAHAHGIPMLVDLGSGTLVDLEQYGLPHERTAREVIAAGADIVTFSGDKLLGGPQAGLVVGRGDLVARIKRNPLLRALRIDKIRLAALEAVLKLYADPARLAERLPTLRWLSRPLEAIEGLARRLQPQVQAMLTDRAEVTVAACMSQIGSGALPIDLLPSMALALRPKHRRGATVDALAAVLRTLPMPVIGRIEGGQLLLDLRTLDDVGELIGQLELLRLGKDRMKEDAGA